MTDEEFKELTTDTDAFMRKRGYISTSEMADKFDVTTARIRQFVQNGLLEDVHVGSRRYLKADVEYPSKRR